MAVSLAASSEPAFAQSRRLVVVVSDSSQNLLPDALVTILPTGLRARSDNAGVATIEGVPQGAQVVNVRRLGYSIVSVPVAVQASGKTELNVVLVRLAERLPTVGVEDTASLPWLKEFDERRRRGTGRYLTLGDIQRFGDTEVGTLMMRRIPGVRVGGTNLHQSAYSTRGQNSFGGNCQVAVIIDGVREPSGNVAAIPVAMLGGMEYYTPSTVPIQYKDPTTVGAGAGTRGGSVACGLLIMWSR